MINISSFNKQHEEIIKNIKLIRDTLSKAFMEEHSSELAKQINLLGGRLKVHLQSEDNYLYPNLLKSQNLHLKKLAETYINEMKNINVVFIKYKEKYNTKSKILTNKDVFEKQTREILLILEKRLNKENNELYPLVQE